MSFPIRSEIRPGLKVQIVEKQNQRSGTRDHQHQRKRRGGPDAASDLPARHPAGRGRRARSGREYPGAAHVPVPLLLTGYTRLDAIPAAPPQTAATWLTIQPYTAIEIGAHEIILVQPSTTFFVYLLGVLAIGGGLYFFRIRQGQRSRVWWGVALILWGAGALLAGTSYEAFSYALKSAGRPACVWTSGWEVGYLILSVASVDAMLLAQAYACTEGRGRRALAIYTVANAAIYLVVVLIGALIPVKFLISFELLILFAAPAIGVFFILNGWRYARLRDGMDLALLGAWAWLVLTLGAYFGYLMLGITQTLWARGVWFSENNVLHIGLIVWMVYLARVVARRVKDRGAGAEPDDPNPTAASPASRPGVGPRRRVPAPPGRGARP